MTSPASRTLRDRILVSLARVTCRFPITVLVAAAALTVVAALYSRAKLEFHGGRDDLVSSSGRYNEVYNEYTEDFGDLDHLVVVAEAPVLDHAKHYLAALGAAVAERQDLVREAFYRINPDDLGATGLLFLSEDQLIEIRSRLDDYQDFLGEFSANPSLNTFFDLVNREVSAGMVSYLVGNLLGTGGSEDEAPVDLTLLNATLREMRTALDQPAAYLSPWDRFMSSSDAEFSQDGYLVTENQRFALMLLDPTEEGRDRLGELRDLMRDVEANFPGVSVGLTGSKALTYAEEQTTARDVAVASVLALVSNLLLLIIPFRAVVKPLFAMLTLVIGSVWSFGLATLVVGHLNLLSAVFTSILFGIGINFPIHLTARYQEARREGQPVAEALETSMVNTGRGVVAAGAIMMLAFCTPMLVAFRGVAELGLIAGLGLFCCLVAAFSVYPALITLQDRRRPAVWHGPSQPMRDAQPRSARMVERHPGLILGVSLAAALAPWPFLSKLSFDENILRLQPQASEAVVYELKLLREGGRSANYAVSIAGSLEELHERRRAFESLPTVHSVRGIDDLVPEHQAEKKVILSTFAPRLDVVSEVQTPTPVNAHRLLKTLDRIGLKLSRGEEEKTWNPDRKPDPESIEAARGLLDGVRERLQRGDPAQVRDRLAAFQARFARDFEAKVEFLRTNLSPADVAIDDVPKTLREGFIGKSGRYLLQVYANDDIWEPAARKTFITELRTVDPEITGGPVMAYEVTEVMKRGYLQAAIWSFVAIFVLVLADFRRLRETFLAMIPLAVGVAWALGVMIAIDLDFNLANLFAVPLIIGMGVDNGVNMLYRFREEGHGAALTKTAVGRSVTVCSLTTIAGFGALVFARHHGIASLGLLLTLGVTAIFVATVVVLPAALVLLDRRALGAGRRRPHPSEASGEHRAGTENGGVSQELRAP